MVIKKELEKRIINEAKTMVKNYFSMIEGIKIKDKGIPSQGRKEMYNFLDKNRDVEDINKLKEVILGYDFSRNELRESKRKFYSSRLKIFRVLGGSRFD